MYLYQTPHVRMLRSDCPRYNESNVASLNAANDMEISGPSTVEDDKMVANDIYVSGVDNNEDD